MTRETTAIRFPLERETLWHERFPALRGRTHGFAIDYLCAKARRGCVARQLYGAAKEIFQLDDTTIRERILEVARASYILVEPGGEPLSNRSFLRPSAALLNRHDTYLLHLAGRVVEIARDLRDGAMLQAPASLSERQRGLLLALQDSYTGAWLDAADTAIAATNPTPARRSEARRRLTTTSYWTLVHRAMKVRHLTRAGGLDNGMEADAEAAAILAVTGQGIQTTRDHIGILLQLGLFERRTDRRLRVALTEPAGVAFDAMLDAFAGDLIEAAARLTPALPAGAPDPDPTPAIERTLRVSAGTLVPEDPEATRGAARLHLMVESPGATIRHVKLRGQTLTVGRTAPADLILDGNDVSRRHCEFRIGRGGVLVTDLGSTNGTFVDGRKIEAPARLAPGGTARIGAHVLTLALATEGA